MSYRIFSVRTIALVLGLAGGLSMSGAVNAQYKWENPDGSVGYGDVPPSRPVKMLKTPAGDVKSAPAEDPGALPYALKQAATRFPVVLYTGSSAKGECAPCVEGRDYLSKRGVPYVEKLVKSVEDMKQFKSNVSAEGSMPVLTVGKEKAVGFESGSWSGLLDAAGYPKTSALPKGYKHAAAVSLTKPVGETVKSDKSDRPEGEPLTSGRNPRRPPPPPAGMVDANAQAKIRF